MIPIHVHVLLFYDDFYIVICFISTAKVRIIYQTEGYKTFFNEDKSLKTSLFAHFSQSFEWIFVTFAHSISFVQKQYS